jgi:tripartite-type tricarboxylate transporter receptor subunit TctC
MKFKFKLMLTASLTAFSLGALAQAAWPDKPVTLIVPFAAGGPTDVVARMIAIPMGKSLGQSVIVENTVGAGGTIAATKVARATPNGNTIFIHHMGMSTAPAFTRSSRLIHSKTSNTSARWSMYP